jgi:menaquinone-dependent protoporphyrinogen oxidase
MSILVAYASRHGSTRGIAERIAERLRADGLDAEAWPAGEVTDASRYDAFVVGAAAYMFHWLKDATTFVGRNRALLATRPTWLFSSGPIGTDTVDKQGRDVLETSVPREFPGLRDAIHPRDERVFFGALDPAARPVGFAERFMALIPAARDALPRGDFRDWPAIDAWADQIAHELGATVAARTMSDGVVTDGRPTIAAGNPIEASATPTSRLKPVVATLFGIPAAVIVLAAANGGSAPLVGDGEAALVALWILGSVMCALGISAMRERFGVVRPNVVGMPLGLLATALVLSGLFGWPLLLQPIVDALGGPGSASLVRAAIVGVGAVMVVKWTIAWLSYLPRRSASAGSHAS